MEFAKRQHYYKTFNPREPLSPEDTRNKNFDGETEVPIRGINWAQTLADEIALETGPDMEPLFKLFTGLPGSGKTTELLRLSSIVSR